MKYRSTTLAPVLPVLLMITGAVTAAADSGVPGSGAAQGVNHGGFRPVQRLLDLSGLVWMGGDTFLAVHDAKFPDELAALYNRPLVGIDVDSLGQVYAVTAFDPDADSGPFRSAVIVIGRVENGGVEVNPAPTVLGTLDGLKVESVALRDDGGTVEVFVGTDDEYYGGTLRQLLVAP